MVLRKYQQEQFEILKAKTCPNCNASNKPDSRFCAKSRMILTYDAYTETIVDRESKKDEIESLKQQVRLMQDSQREILECLRYPQRLAQISKG